MGMGTATAATCMPTLQNYKDFFGKNAPIGTDVGSTGTLQMLKSSENTSGFKQLSDYVTGVPGKRRGVRMQYLEEVCISVCATAFTCAETKHTYTGAMKTVDYEITTRWHPCKTVDAVTKPAELILTETAFRQYCELDNAELFKEMIMRYDTKFIEEMDVEILTAMQAEVLPGNSKTFPFFATNTMTGQKYLTNTWLVNIKNVLRADGKDIKDYMILGGLFTDYIKLLYGNEVTATTEQNAKALSNLPSIYYDANFDSIFANNSFLLVPKGAFQLVQWLANERAYKDERLIKAVKNVPLGNGMSIPIDWKWNYDPECEDYRYFPSTYMELALANSETCSNAKENNIYLFDDCDLLDLPTC